MLNCDGCNFHCCSGGIALALLCRCEKTARQASAGCQYVLCCCCRDLVYEACSKVVDGVMGHDVMKSVANLVPDLLARSHVLLYQGQFDAECGVASNEAWISKLAW
eukprot:GHRQ01022738.1.p1 GENE.GHRQ01022738.1~~GHRQ01022738.1.p1  ORF type:complete len:106 (-),score=28.84 GHRQ01022738.1:596-913(-)